MTVKLNTIVVNTDEFLRFLKSRFSLFHLSNVFFRDFQYGIISYAESKGISVSYGKAEELAAKLVESLVLSGTLKPIKPGSWMLSYPEFRAQPTRPSVSAKASAAPSATQPKPAAVASTQVSGSTSPVVGSASPASSTKS